MHCLRIGLLLANQGEHKRAVELYGLASRYPYVANSRWFEDIAGRYITVAAATLPPGVVTAAQERGRAGELSDVAGAAGRDGGVTNRHVGCGSVSNSAAALRILSMFLVKRAALQAHPALDAHTERGAAEALTRNPTYHSLICSIPRAAIDPGARSPAQADPFYTR